jgi:hypothetical protein
LSTKKSWNAKKVCVMLGVEIEELNDDGDTEGGRGCLYSRRMAFSDTFYANAANKRAL